MTQPKDKWNMQEKLDTANEIKAIVRYIRSKRRLGISERETIIEQLTSVAEGLTQIKLKL